MMVTPLYAGLLVLVVLAAVRALRLIAMLELSHFSIYVLHALGLTLLVARLLHGYALSYTQQFQFGRVAGAGLTFLVLLVAAVLCVYQAILAHRLW